MSKILNEYLNQECTLTISGAEMLFGSGGAKQVIGKILEIDDMFIKFQATKSTLGAVAKDHLAIINQKYIIAINV